MVGIFFAPTPLSHPKGLEQYALCTKNVIYIVFLASIYVFVSSLSILNNFFKRMFLFPGTSCSSASGTLGGGNTAAWPHPHTLRTRPLKPLFQSRYKPPLPPPDILAAGNGPRFCGRFEKAKLNFWVQYFATKWTGRLVLSCLGWMPQS